MVLAILLLFGSVVEVQRNQAFNNLIRWNVKGHGRRNASYDRIIPDKSRG
jgi:hypothetical protein